jgi:hypothetical protein
LFRVTEDVASAVDSRLDLGCKIRLGGLAT